MIKEHCKKLKVHENQIIKLKIICILWSTSISLETALEDIKCRSWAIYIDVHKKAQMSENATIQVTWLIYICLILGGKKRLGFVLRHYVAYIIFTLARILQDFDDDKPQKCLLFMLQLLCICYVVYIYYILSIYYIY